MAACIDILQQYGLTNICLVASCRNVRIPALPPIANPSSVEGVLRLQLPALASDSREGISSRVDALEQVSFDVQRELVLLRADMRTRWNEDEMNRNVLRGEVEMLKESLRMKEEAIERLTKLVCREVKSKHEKDILAAAASGSCSGQESLAAVSGCYKRWLGPFERATSKDIIQLFTEFR